MSSKGFCGAGSDIRDSPLGRSQAQYHPSKDMIKGYVNTSALVKHSLNDVAFSIRKRILSLAIHEKVMIPAADMLA